MPVTMRTKHETVLFLTEKIYNERIFTVSPICTSERQAWFLAAAVIAGSG